jgi:RNA polymerase sigma-70 factor (ECF subfamily)
MTCEMPGLSEAALLDSFEQHRNELRLHCYRMLGSSHDADDMLQEAALRAWRGQGALAEAANLRAWLYRITTNVCLDELARRRARTLPYEAGTPASEPGSVRSTADREAFIEPCPQLWFEATPSDPSLRYETRESVALAFVAALQQLTPTQRATLLLRDVVGLSAEETAQALELNLQAVNSALFRARTAVETKLAGRDPEGLQAPNAATQGLLARYLSAWNQLDVTAFVALLHDEVRTTMPPSPSWLAGRADNVAFYRAMFAAQRPGAFVAIPTAANATAAFAFYRSLAAGEPHVLRAIHLVELKDDAIIGIDHFMLPELGPLFGLPSSLGRAQIDVALDARSCLELIAEHFSTRARSHS